MVAFAGNRGTHRMEGVGSNLEVQDILCTITASCHGVDQHCPCSWAYAYIHMPLDARKDYHQNRPTHHIEGMENNLAGHSRFSTLTQSCLEVERHCHCSLALACL